MPTKLKRIIDEITPPIILRGVNAVLGPSGGNHGHPEPSGQKDASWYDASFDANDAWRSHYSESEYYFLWTVIADRIERAKIESILEIGCGPTQLACLLKDKGIRKYHGFDFSARRIEQAKQVCPEFKFSLQDAFQTDLFTTVDYDAVICTEFLEHVEKDIEALKRIRSGARFYGTVPNFPFTSHVRHFGSEDEVRSRYSRCFSDLRVDVFLANVNGKAFYLLEGEIA
ncbi:MAG TPA: class I SAM-dependent methyltransferase [Acidobacteriaceae bacterium]|nr:class I SAM-dependent methyltransferase [Acidobacteriaceae bacterium]